MAEITSNDAAANSANAGRPSADTLLVVSSAPINRGVRFVYVDSDRIDDGSSWFEANTIDSIDLFRSGQIRFDYRPIVTLPRNVSPFHLLFASDA
jgi:hypothetical protein